LKNWEQYLYENGYRMVKIFLHVGRDAQKERFLDRLERDDKHWKLSLADMEERDLWDAYDEAFEDAINATGTPESPWYVIPADNKWYTRYLTSEILLHTLKEMDPQYPKLSQADAEKVPETIEKLRNEK
jgi:polyphosphate kinase 2 (PPK2 family)